MTTTDTTTTTVAAELRAAAAQLRDTAKTATRGPWVPYPTITADQHDEAWTISRTLCDKDPCEPDCGHTVLTTGAEGCEEDNIRGEDVSWICLVNPLLAESLANSLEQAAKEYEFFGDSNAWHLATAASLLPVARFINGTAAAVTA